MEPIQRGSGRVKGVEILYFEEAEIEKSKGSDISFAASGHFSVLYFKDFNRFVLQLNDWKYPLMRRLNISSSSVKDDPSSRTYVLPAPNGFSFILRISKVANNQAFQNFETILDQSSRFSVFGKEIPYRKLEASPEIERNVKRLLDRAAPKEMITETVKKVINQVQNKAATLKTGTKHLTSTKQKVDLKDIKNKNFKKEAKSSFKKDFFETSEKISKEFLQKRKNNPNMNQLREFDDLKKTSDSHAPSLYVHKKEIENAISRNKEMYSYLNQNQNQDQQPTVVKPEERRRGLMTNLREGARNIRDRVSHLVSGDKGTTGQEALGQPERVPVSEGVSHYEG